MLSNCYVQMNALSHRCYTLNWSLTVALCDVSVLKNTTGSKSARKISNIQLEKENLHIWFLTFIRGGRVN